jgi:hypothetical protein
MAAKKKKRSRKSGRLGGTPAEHEARAQEILMGAKESVASAEKMLRAGDCQRAYTILQAASVFVGRAEADYDAAVAASPWTPAGRAYSENLNRLESNLYATDSGVANKLSRVADKFAAVCVIKK